MAKAKTIYTCTECGGQSPKWQGQCPHCEQWNTLVEGVSQAPSAKAGNRYSSVGGVGKLLTLPSIGKCDKPHCTPAPVFRRGDIMTVPGCDGSNRPSAPLFRRGLCVTARVNA